MQFFDKSKINCSWNSAKLIIEKISIIINKTEKKNVLLNIYWRCLEILTLRFNEYGQINLKLLEKISFSFVWNVEKKKIMYFDWQSWLFISCIDQFSYWLSKNSFPTCIQWLYYKNWTSLFGRFINLYRHVHRKDFTLKDTLFCNLKLMLIMHQFETTNGARWEESSLVYPQLNQIIFYVDLGCSSRAHSLIEAN